MAYTLLAHDFLMRAPSSCSMDTELLARLLVEDGVSMGTTMFLGSWLLKSRSVQGYAQVPCLSGHSRRVKRGHSQTLAVWPMGKLCDPHRKAFSMHLSPGRLGKGVITLCKNSGVLTGSPPPPGL